MSQPMANRLALVSSFKTRLRPFSSVALYSFFKESAVLYICVMQRLVQKVFFGRGKKLETPNASLLHGVTFLPYSNND